MVTSLEEWSMLEMRGVVRILHTKDSSLTKFKNKTVLDYGKDVVNKRISGAHRVASLWSFAERGISDKPKSANAVVRHLRQRRYLDVRVLLLWER